jgi:type I restriction enzyme R subunit
MLSESERRTRKARIDPRLRAQGWEPVPYGAPLALNQAVEEYPTTDGPADYALSRSGAILAVVEAKKLATGPQNVLTQAERYARGISDSQARSGGVTLRYGDFHVPFLYSTNGEVIWFRDVRHPYNLSRRVAEFHTPAALTEMLERDHDRECARLRALPNEHPWLRPYQRKANEAVEAAIAARKRALLVAMATGTGKTFTLVNQAYRLIRSGAARRILFLVDRRALAAQAVRAFHAFEAEPGRKFTDLYPVYSQSLSAADAEDDATFNPEVLPASYLTHPGPQHTFVYVSTIQRLAMQVLGSEAALESPDGTLELDAQKLPIPIHAFDVIIADECHRGYTALQEATWQKTLEHFDAIKIGLTATPAKHTVTLFGEPVFRYAYREAVEEGFLVDYDVVAVRSEARINGVFLSEGERVQVVDTRTGQTQLDFLEDQREYATTEIEARVTSPDSNRRMLEEIRKYAVEHEARYGRFPKTLIFAANDLPHTSHSDQIVEIAREVFGRGEEFVEKITGKVDRPLRRIREFRNRPEPGVAVTVDLLTTGVDIPDLEYIVFMRPVQSRILFEQMLGRGTRKGEQFPDKSHFTVFDCFDGTLVEYFREASAMAGEAPTTSGKTLAEIIQAIYENRDRDYHVRLLAKRLLRIEKEMSGDAIPMFAAFIPDGDVGRFARELPVAISGNLVATLALLRNPDFQKLLLDYPRRPRDFTIAVEHTDTVTSEWRARGLDGREYKPEDYLEAFSRYVRESGDEIEALGILLRRPADWSPQALTELQRKLETRPERFTREQLQRAHQYVYRKALADFISMVKHAAREESPLLTAEERAARAMEAVTAGRYFDEEQRRWLGFIQDHLKESLSLDMDDFDHMPVFLNAGGRGRARRVFAGELEELVRRVNEAVAA